MTIVNNKNAFQWDAYHPLVDRIPACTGQGGGVYPSMHWAGGCVYPSMHWAGGCLDIPKGGGGCLPIGVSVCGRHPSPHLGPKADMPLLWTDRHLWKHYHRRLRLRAVKITVLHMRSEPLRSCKRSTDAKIRVDYPFLTIGSLGCRLRICSVWWNPKQT